MSTPRDRTDPALALRGLTVRHADAAAPTLREVTLDVAAGEIVLVLGPSGSGKSTLALALNGLVPHEIPVTFAGSVEAGGLDTSRSTVAELSTRVAMVFQDPDSQLVTGSVLDEVAFGPENLRMSVDEVLARSESALRRMGLWHRRHENPDVLSGGGRQRLALACALAMDPRVLVLDEPTANLDPGGAADLYTALEDATEEKRTIVLIEHDLDAAVGIATRVVVLDRDGRLAHDGTVDQVLRERAEQLAQMGVWLPHATLAALRLRRAGYRIDPLPLTAAELHAHFVQGSGAEVPAGADVHAERAEAPAAEVDSPGRDIQAAGTDVTAPGADDVRTADEHGANVTAGAAGSAADPSVTTNDALIRVRDLSVERGGTRILHNIDLDVHAGAFTAFIGPNGAGKTTLLQAIAGVVAPPRGRIQVADLDPGRATPRRLIERIGFVFQNPEHQFVTNAVRDELAHGLRRLRKTDREMRERVDEMLERLGLAGLADAHPFRLSGGQKRRLSVGTALITEPSVLALDEPTYGQDRARADELLSLLRDLNRQGTTVLIVTHDLHLVAEYASRAVAIASGRIVAAGTPADLFLAGGVERAGLRPPALYQTLRDYPPHARSVILPALAEGGGGDQGAGERPDGGVPDASNGRTRAHPGSDA